MFEQRIQLAMKDPSHLIESQTFDVEGSVGSVELKVKPGYEAYVVEFFDPYSSENQFIEPGKVCSYKKKDFNGKKFSVVLYQNNDYSMTLPVRVFGDTYKFRATIDENHFFDFPLVGEANVEIRRIRDVAKHVQRDCTLDELKKILDDSVKRQIATILKQVGDKYLYGNEDLVSSDARALLPDIKKEAFGDRNIKDLLVRLGVYLIPTKSNVNFNLLPSVAKQIDEIVQKKNAAAMRKLDAEEKAAERRVEQEDEQIKHEHKIEEIRAENTQIKEIYTDHKENPHKVKEEKHFCISCGKEIKAYAKFCPYCGEKQ
ncbi:MAG: zinc ribbon domain-containing protein [Bacilli bacterium]|nr:zinc ribbon domain-containing protein [Bacilli bacterium]